MLLKQTCHPLTRQKPEEGFLKACPRDGRRHGRNFKNRSVQQFGKLLDNLSRPMDTENSRQSDKLDVLHMGSDELGQSKAEFRCFQVMGQRHRTYLGGLVAVNWNQMPVLIAADLWREYLSKFTLAELFEVSQPGPRPKPPVPAPELTDTMALMQPVTPSSGLDRALAGMLHEVNNFLGRIVDRCERAESRTVKHVTPAPKPKGVEPKAQEPKLETALETINRMIEARMTEAKVTVLDDSGKPGNDLDDDNSIDSPEYELLKRRGIKVLSAGVGNLRFPPNIEEQLVRQWSTTWLDSAKAERDRIDRLRGFVELSGQAEAVHEYTKSLSTNLLRHRPSTQKDTLKILMLRSRDELVKNDRLHRRASMEREELEELIQWVERNGL